ncbi:unnamed protein product [Lactuca virosa]|uniref:Uncharacterized protein n=1 Tax=Lactuca virosa TaxID=75947 RepID=A0AAU9MNV0_9ASTR|nr:unnamed protein product [Lactuca virosa]
MSAILSMEVDDGTETHHRGVCTPSVKGRQSMDSNEEIISPSPRYKHVYMSDKTKNKRKNFDHTDPFAIRDFVLGFDSPKYGSVTKDIEDLFSRKKQMFMPTFRKFPLLGVDSLDLKPRKDISIVIENTKHDTNAQAPQLVVIIDSDDDEPTYQIPSKSFQDAVIKIPSKPYVDIELKIPSKTDEDIKLTIPSKPYEDTKLKIPSKPHEDIALKIGSKPCKDTLLNKPTELSMEQILGGDDGLDQATKEGGDRDTLTVVAPSVEKEKSFKDDDMDSEKKHDDVDNDKHGDMDSGGKKHDKGKYVGVEDDDSDEQPEADFDGLGDIWKEMTIGLESSKDRIPASDENANEEGKDCDHTFILKEDIGSVCRVCGIIDKSIESIIEFQRPKTIKSTRTYHYESQTKRGDRANPVLNGVKLPGNDFSVCEVIAHPRHKKQMKPHQIEGFNFLLSNLVCDNPGGCILAHAPGSGKTFMLISFIQSFMAKYPDARPLVILPRGILGTWKKEFTRWQVEDLPLFDLYSVKAEGRVQQFEVLKQWANQRSILFLGYQQFSSIVCDDDTSSIPVSCQEILLTYPSLLILDEGHTPRNQDTNILTSLEKIQTPRKVVLSGTLYQNHVREVFNILNLVRPKFLRMENSKAIKRRILSRVPIESRRNLLKKSTDNEFYEVVEHTLLKDEDFKRKVTVIEDLRDMTNKVLHYYKGDSLDELPGLVDFSVFLNLSPKQKRHVTELKKLKKKFKISSDGSAIYVHPALKSVLKTTKDKNDDDISKIDEILETLDEREGVKAKFYLNLLRLCESEGEKLLVFGQYLLPLKFLLRLTVKTKGWSLGKEVFMITGDHDNDEREIAMDQFNNSPDSRVFFGSIKACGEGISLVGASRIIILDIHLNPSVTRQAIGRAFRPGQIRKVYTYRLIAADSPEADDHETCFKKESIAKMWFEWNEYCGHHDFEMETTSVEDCGDPFLETSWLNEDVTAIYKR